MGILDRFLYKEVPDKESTDDAKNVVTPLVTQVPDSFKPNNVFAGKSNTFTPAGGVSSQPSAEEMGKWQNYFTKLLETAKGQNALYGQFLSNIEMVSETDTSTPIANKFKLAYKFMKGTTKQQIIDAAMNALAGIVNDRKATFEQRQAQKTKEGIDDKSQVILNNQEQIRIKTEEIKKLTEDNARLETEKLAARDNIAERLACYNILSEQLVAKVKDDITGLNNYL